MRVHEYLDQATAYISAPDKALEVRRELKAHMDEAMADALARGLDPETAELVAVGQMGDPRRVAAALAAAHHKHLPWRHYMTPLPLLLMLYMSTRPYLFDAPVAAFVWLLLLYCLAPSPTTIARWVRELYLDVLAKVHWLECQPLREAALSGGVAGLSFGLSLMAVGVMLKNNTKGDILVLVAGFVALTLGSLTFRWMRRRHKAAPVLTAAFAAMGFSVGISPLLLGEFEAWLVYSTFFGLILLAVGQIAQFAVRRGWVGQTEVTTKPD